MGDEHLDTIPEKESDELIKSSVESLVPIPTDLYERESFSLDHFDDSSLPSPHPEPPDVEISLNFEPDAPVINNFDELNEDECFDPRGGEINVSQNVEEDDSFTFVIRTPTLRILRYFSPPGVRMLFLTLAFPLFIFLLLSRWHMKIRW
ncbi:hypothetical protein Tco_1098922 [Tanacetum coccineum]